jgi:hypothetical protein
LAKYIFAQDFQLLYSSKGDLVLIWKKSSVGLYVPLLEFDLRDRLAVAQQVIIDLGREQLRGAE